MQEGFASIFQKATRIRQSVCILATDRQAGICNNVKKEIGCKYVHTFSAKGTNINRTFSGCPD